MNRSDAHSDHRYTFEAVAACTKSFRYPFVKKVCVYETLSETEFGMRLDDSGFKPNMWVNITDYLDRKIEIMKIFESELGNHPFPRSVENIISLAKLRGSTANTDAAECFVILKEIL